MKAMLHYTRRELRVTVFYTQKEKQAGVWVSAMHIGQETPTIESQHRVTCSYSMEEQFHGAARNRDVWHCP